MNLILNSYLTFLYIEVSHTEFERIIFNEKIYGIQIACFSSNFVNLLIVILM